MTAVTRSHEQEAVAGRPAPAALPETPGASATGTIASHGCAIRPSPSGAQAFSHLALLEAAARIIVAERLEEYTS
jgi:hypothetical protein